MVGRSRIVLDTNVVVSAALAPRSVPRQCLDTALEWHAVLISEDVLAEYGRKLMSAKFDRWVAREPRHALLLDLTQCETVTIRHTVSGSRDPDDNKILELAVNGQADLIVSGDKDLTSLGKFRDIAIVTARQFLAGYAGLPYSGEILGASGLHPYTATTPLSTASSSNAAFIRACV